MWIDSVEGQLSLMGTTAVAMAIVLLTLLRLRRVLGLVPVYTTLGVLYHLAGLLAGALYVQVTPQLVMGPGSVVLFPANLFVVLFLYIQEDAYEARRLIYGLFATNVVVIVAGALISLHLGSPLVINPHKLAPELFLQQPRIALVGAAVLYIDTILIVLVYECAKRFMKGRGFFPIWFAMTAVLTFDQLLFVTGAFAGSPGYVQLLVSGLVGKLATALIYSSCLALYLGRFETARLASSLESPLGDVLQLLTYRKKYEALRSQIGKDALTGVHNRGFFDEALLRAIEEGRRDGTPVLLLMVDVDSFKSINDAAGHLAGDRVLQSVAATLTSEARGADLVCRYGGEEFALILPATNLSQGEALAKRLLKAVPNACSFVDGDIKRPVTVTIGLAMASEADTPEGLVAIADERLYTGKRAGRNQVVSVTERPPA